MTNKNIILFIQIDHQTNQIIVKSENNIFSEKKSFLVFDNNEIMISNDQPIDNSINILETKEKEIEYNGKQYKLTQEELFTIYLSLLLDEIEKNYIVSDIQIQNENKQFDKIKQLLGFNEQLPEQEYKQIDEIITHNNIYKKFKHQIERMQQIMKERNDTKHPELLNLNPNKEFSETKLQEIKSQLTCKERTKYKLYELNDNYCLFLSSTYFESINDFKNLEFATRRALNNTEKFHYNPIPLTTEIRHLFPNVETLFIYDINNYESFEEDKRIIKRFCVHPISTLQFNDLSETKKQQLIFKTIYFNKEDRIYFRSSIPKYVNEIAPNTFENYFLQSFELPSNITRIGNNCFKNCLSLKSISIPSTMTSLEKELFSHCSYLTRIELPNTLTSIGEKCFSCCVHLSSIKIPSSVEFIGRRVFSGCTSLTSLTIGKQWKLHGNRLFNNWNGLLIGVEIPSSVKEINQKEVEITPLEHFDIPENIYKIYDYCFEDCYSLKTTNILSTVKYIGKNAFKFCTKLETQHSLRKKEEIKSKPMIKEVELTLLEEWSETKFKEVIFDTEYCDWADGTSTFFERILNKERLLFLIEDINNCIFGGYINNIIDKYFFNQNGWICGEGINDINAFVFSLRSKDQNKIPSKHSIIDKDGRWAFNLFQNQNDNMFVFGRGYDILMKYENDLKQCCCIQSSFDYNWKKSVLIENENDSDRFVPKRLQVFQMNENNGRKLLKNTISLEEWFEGILENKNINELYHFLFV